MGKIKFVNMIHRRDDLHVFQRQKGEKKRSSLVSVPQRQKRSGSPMGDAPIDKAQSRRAEGVQVPCPASPRTLLPGLKSLEIPGLSHRNALSWAQ